MAGQDPDPEKKTRKCGSKGKNRSRDLGRKTGKCRPQGKNGSQNLEKKTRGPTTQECQGKMAGPSTKTPRVCRPRGQHQRRVEDRDMKLHHHQCQGDPAEEQLGPTGILVDNHIEAIMAIAMAASAAQEEEIPVKPVKPITARL